ncbi:LAETG motif-containing sortase-dependent surface protein [Streptomyces sp. NPDC089424]|uniref:LAETG motif-containing sortase-dependent surface protein n=1 Tax=Streptomyces sp. NPDC089424 TaxID=3365917 RepID=UPI0038211553
MSIARRVTMRRLLGTGAASLALCAASASGAWATGSPGGGDGWGAGGQYRPGTGAGTVTGSDRCEFSLDGAHFQDSVKVDDVSLRPTDDGKVHIEVRAAGDATTCTASLASYLAHGATFATSGEQKFVDFDTVTVQPGRTESLDIAVPDAGCFAQIDLYRGAVKYDGLLGASDGFEHGELPKGPDRPVIKDKLIAAWNGGTKDCTTTPSQPPATTPPATTPPESAEPSPPAATTPAQTEPAGEPPSSTSPSASPSTPAPNAPSPAGPGDDLAETGADSNTTPIALGAGALLVGGAVIVATTRRRRSTDN